MSLDRNTYRAFHALGHIQQELRDGQAPRTPDLEKPFQTIPPPGILLGGHAGSPARGRHGFKPCPFRRSGRGQRPPFRHGRRGGHSHLCALPLMSDGSAPPGISTGSILAVRRRQGRSPTSLKNPPTAALVTSSRRTCVSCLSPLRPILHAPQPQHWRRG
mgnify:CR=1 FL=1